MNDGQHFEFIKNPALIDTHELALQVMDSINMDIASIDAQLDASAILAGNRGLRNDEETWVKRACYALAMRKRDLHKVYHRDKELRGFKGAAQTEKSIAKQNANQAKHERMQAEAEERKLRKQLEVEKAHAHRLALEQKARETKLEIMRLKAALAEQSIRGGQVGMPVTCLFCGESHGPETNLPCPKSLIVGGGQ